jgi:hypothetical protein
VLRLPDNHRREVGRLVEMLRSRRDASDVTLGVIERHVPIVGLVPSARGASYGLGRKMYADSTYESIVARHGLGGILAAGDLQLTPSGNIAATPDRDLKFGNEQCNAMHRLVLRWRSNARVLETLLDLVAVDNLRKHMAEAEREAIVYGSPVSEFPSLERIEEFNARSEEAETGEFGSAACAGAIMVVLNNLLQRYKNDLSRVSPKWRGIGPQFNGYSLGEVIEAASNNFRHHDEWARAQEPTQKQLKSIRVIEAALG